MDLATLKAEADSLGIQYHKTIGAVKLQDKINNHKGTEVAEPKETAVVGKVVGKNIKTMTTSEYAEYSKKNGRIMGREEGTKTVLTTQELRVLINSNWTPEMVKEKHGLNDSDLTQVVFRLSKEERRDTPIKFGKVVVNG